MMTNKTEIALMVLVACALLSMFYSLGSIYSNCDGTVVRTLFWVECVDVKQLSED